MGFGDPSSDAREADERPVGVELEAGEPAQRLLEEYPGLEPREVAAEAEVLPPAERDVAVWPAAQVELVGLDCSTPEPTASSRLAAANQTCSTLPCGTVRS